MLEFSIFVVGLFLQNLLNCWGLRRYYYNKKYHKTNWEMKKYIYKIKLLSLTMFYSVHKYYFFFPFYIWIIPLLTEGCFQSDENPLWTKCIGPNTDLPQS